MLGSSTCILAKRSSQLNEVVVLSGRFSHFDFVVVVKSQDITDHFANAIYFDVVHMGTIVDNGV